MPSSLEDALETVISDDELKRRLSLKAKLTVRASFSWERNTSRVERVYKEVT